MVTCGGLTSDASSCAGGLRSGQQSRGAPSALKPIKATWVRSREDGRQVCCAERWPGAAGCLARLVSAHMLHNRFLGHKKAVCVLHYAQTQHTPRRSSISLLLLWIPEFLSIIRSFLHQIQFVWQEKQPDWPFTLGRLSGSLNKCHYPSIQEVIRWVTGLNPSIPTALRLRLQWISASKLFTFYFFIGIWSYRPTIWLYIEVKHGFLNVLQQKCKKFVSEPHF